MYIIRILIAQPIRLLLTLSGISLCIILILFILGIYNGVAEGSIEYIKQSKTDIWVLQSNSTNIMRGTSILPESYGEIIKSDSMIESVTPVLMMLTTINAGGKNATVLLTGYIPGSAGGPPQLYEGKNIEKNNEIVLDRSFAEKYKIKTGQKVKIHDDTLTVTGLSKGTNAFVTQYAFVTLEFEQSIVEMPGMVSYFLIKSKPKCSIDALKERIEKRLQGRISAYSGDKFLENNIREIESGILPVFYAIVVIGGIILTIILSLILSVNILEKRKDFAIMKVLGSSKYFLDSLIVSLALSLSLASEAIGIILFFPLEKLIAYVSPEVTTIIKAEYIIYTTIIACTVSLFSSLFACRRIRKIYPLEVFS